jgi:hypothetical protein
VAKVEMGPSGGLKKDIALIEKDVGGRLYI